MGKGKGQGEGAAEGVGEGAGEDLAESMVIKGGIAVCLVVTMCLCGLPMIIAGAVLLGLYISMGWVSYIADLFDSKDPSL